MTEPSSNQMCTLQLLHQENLLYSDDAEVSAGNIWGLSNASYNAQHRLFTKADYVRGNSYYQDLLSGYSDNQCIPFSVFKNWNWSDYGNYTMNFTKDWEFNVKGKINVYYYSPNIYLKAWEVSWLYRGGLTVVNWNGDNSRPEGYWQCPIGSPNSPTTLYRHTYGYGDNKHVYRTLGYDYSSGWVHLFSTTFGHNSTLKPYVSVCLLYNESEFGNIGSFPCSIDGMVSTGDRKLRVKSSTAVTVSINKYLHRMYSIHSPVPFSNGSTVNIYIYTDPA